jgi:hypothetical protein
MQGMDGFWIGVAIAVGLVFFLTWLGAQFARGGDGDEEPQQRPRRRRNDQPFVPGPDRDDPMF